MTTPNGRCDVAGESCVLFRCAASGDQEPWGQPGVPARAAVGPRHAAQRGDAELLAVRAQPARAPDVARRARVARGDPAPARGAPAVAAAALAPPGSARRPDVAGRRGAGGRPGAGRLRRQRRRRADGDRAQAGRPDRRRRAAARPRRRRARRCCTAAGRSATCAPARSTRRASPRSRSRSRSRSRASRSTPPGSARCATTWSRGSAPRCPDAIFNGDPDRPAAGQRALLVPRLRGRRAAAAARRAGDRVLDRLGVLGRRRAALPRAARDGRRRRPGPVVAALHPRPHLDRRPTWTRWSPRCRRAVERARRAGLVSPADRRVDRSRRPVGTLVRVRVLAAMSGGVDSAVAAARAVDAGHDVTGVHLALSRNPQTYRTGARGCCTLEDARDARRAADVIGIPFYVWDMAEQFHEDVVDDFVAEYAAGRTPNPCLRCNEKIKFAAVLDRAVALGFDAVVTGHHARLGPDGLLRRSVDLGQGPVVRAGGADPRPARPVDVPARRLDQGAGARRGGRARAGGGRQARLARHLLHRRRRHPRLPAPSGSARRRATSSTRAPARCSASTTGRTRYTVGQRKGLDLRVPGAGRPAALRAVDHAGDQHGDASARPRRSTCPRWTATGRCGRRAGADRPGRVRGAAARARRGRCPARGRRSTASGCARELRAPARGVAAGQADGGLPAATRPATWCSARPPITAGSRVTELARWPWPAGRATGIGSLPGTDIAEAQRVVLGELPDLPHLPELPARGPGCRHDRARRRRSWSTCRSSSTPARWRVAAAARPRPAPRPRPAGARPRRADRAGRRATPARSRCRPPGRGRSPPRSSCRSAAGCCATTARSATSPSRWPRGCARTSPTCARRLPGADGAAAARRAVAAGRAGRAGADRERASARYRVGGGADGGDRAARPWSTAVGAPVVVHCCAPRRAAAAVPRAPAPPPSPLDLSTWSRTLDPLGEAIDAGLGLFAGVAPDRRHRRRRARPGRPAAARLAAARLPGGPARRAGRRHAGLRAGRRRPGLRPGGAGGLPRGGAATAGSAAPVSGPATCGWSAPTTSPTRLG